MESVKQDQLNSEKIVVAGMATMPSRRDSFQFALDSILPQVDRLYLFLDRFEKPHKLSDTRVIVLNSETHGDLRANGKFLGLTIQKGDFYYFSVDDDIIYPSDYVSNMIDFLNKSKAPIIAGIHGSILNKEFNQYQTDRKILHRSMGLRQPVKLDVLGTCTVGFRSSTIQFDVRRWPTINMVDLNFAIECERRKIMRYSIPRQPGWIQCIEECQKDSIFHQLRQNDSQQTKLAKQFLDMKG